MLMHTDGESILVHRRTGGLENTYRAEEHGCSVHRRTGGLEIDKGSHF